MNKKPVILVGAHSPASLRLALAVAASQVAGYESRIDIRCTEPEDLVVEAGPPPIPQIDFKAIEPIEDEFFGRDHHHWKGGSLTARHRPRNYKKRNRK